MDFYHYLEDNGKICVDEENRRFYRYIDSPEHDNLYIEFNGIGRFMVDPIVKFTNQYFSNCFK